ncbi:hypothetical protein Mgra_00003176, partial [Meloidogyne graminicola]
PLLWIFENKGYLRKDSIIGTPIQFNGPLRTFPTKKDNQLINVFIYEPFLIRKYFNIIPSSPIKSGQSFKIILAKQLLNEYINVDYLNITIQAQQLQFNLENNIKVTSQLNIEQRELQIKLINNENKEQINKEELIQNNILIAKINDFDCNKINVIYLIYLKPIYAFAFNPFNLNNSNNNLLIGYLNILTNNNNNNNINLQPKLIISEGGEEGLFNLKKENNKGLLIYKGIIGQFNKNYTLKVILISNNNYIDYALIHVLIPGIGSSSPIFQKPFQRIIVHKYNNSDIINNLFILSAEDLDPDAHLIYELINYECKTISGNEIKKEECLEYFSLSPNNETIGQWILSLIEKEENNKNNNNNNFNIEDINNYYIKQQQQLGEALLNISVRDEIHPLESNSYTLVLIKFSQQNENQNIIKENFELINLNNKFKQNFLINLFPIILNIKDSSPINTLIYSFGIFEDLKKEKFIYSITGHGNKFFLIDKELGNYYLKYLKYLKLKAILSVAFPLLNIGGSIFNLNILINYLNGTNYIQIPIIIKIITKNNLKKEFKFSKNYYKINNNNIKEEDKDKEENNKIIFNNNNENNTKLKLLFLNNEEEKEEEIIILNNNNNVINLI